jgi:hypothetical protein
MVEEPSYIKNETEGLAWRISLSILVAVGWLVFLLIWLFFYANQYPWEKNLAVILLSLLVLIGIVGGPWAYWAFKKQTPPEKTMWRQKGFQWRFWTSLLIGLALICFLIYWFWTYAAPYDVYQNFAIFIITLLIAAGLTAAMWVPWGMKYGPDQDQQKKE